MNIFISYNKYFYGKKKCSHGSHNVKITFYFGGIGQVADTQHELNILDELLDFAVMQQSSDVSAKSYDA